MKLKDLTEQTFTYLTVTERSENRVIFNYSQEEWNVIKEKYFITYNLEEGEVVSYD